MDEDNLDFEVEDPKPLKMVPLNTGFVTPYKQSVQISDWAGGSELMATKKKKRRPNPREKKDKPKDKPKEEMGNENPIKMGKILKMKNVRNVLKLVTNSLDESIIKKIYVFKTKMY